MRLGELLGRWLDTTWESTLLFFCAGASGVCWYEAMRLELKRYSRTLLAESVISWSITFARRMGSKCDSKKMLSWSSLLRRRVLLRFCTRRYYLNCKSRSLAEGAATEVNWGSNLCTESKCCRLRTERRTLRLFSAHLSDLDKLLLRCDIVLL